MKRSALACAALAVLLALLTNRAECKPIENSSDTENHANVTTVEELVESVATALDAAESGNATATADADARYFPSQPGLVYIDPQSRIQIPLNIPFHRIPGWPQLANRFDAVVGGSPAGLTGRIRGIADYCYGLLCRFRKALTG